MHNCELIASCDFSTMTLDSWRQNGIWSLEPLAAVITKVFHGKTCVVLHLNVYVVAQRFEIWGTGFTGLTRGMATLPQGNLEPLAKQFNMNLCCSGSVFSPVCLSAGN